MSLLQQHFEERREYIFNRLKQPEYMERSIEKVRQAQKEIKNTVRTIKDLLLLDKTTDPCLPEVAQFSLQHITNSESFENVKNLVPSSIKKLSEEERAKVLDETLSVANQIMNLERTVFIMMFNAKEKILMDSYKKKRRSQTELHYDVADKEGFDKAFYEERIDSLRNDIRVISFKKLCENESAPEDLELFKQRYETIILPKVQEIVSLIEPSLIDIDVFLNPVIEYGVGEITLDEMIEKLNKNLSLFHELSKIEYCPTVELTVKEYVFLEAMNRSKKGEELQPSK
ncbi:TPA: hypothetical protein ROY30_005696 [Bacillus cereus]|uniref:Uncharacterized protein n=1 Tax=Bacillus paranthracis TaxID=2026186 RepID=A0A9X8X4W4_9BACI|nr:MULTISPECIES: hypothetical protein [Bacillus]KXY80485.1 hypothetical protein AT258_17270 [Bacillus wiedmannii]MBL3848021.1 hypothetical protein [Bacillus cereus]MDA2593859.1 hypothetical protein [Bacillus cereus group sp. Bc065]SME02211.1 hypothetical protein BACERE00221_02119 [Bacillus paranthracis]HDX9631918.1 hypothetical protein [Bacillus cereus]